MTGTLKDKEDAFGHMLWAYYKGENVFEVIERDDGYIDVINPEIYFSKYENWPQIEQEAMKSIRGRVLDIGCGAGRHSIYLQNKGFNVVGIDISPLAIKVCRLRGLKKAKIMPIEELNFKPRSFDTVIMMGNNFGLFGSFKKAQKILRKLHEITSKEALIIAETRDPYKTNNPAHLEYHEWNKKRGRMGGQVRIRHRFRKYIGRWFDYLLVSKDEMRKILKGTEWKIERFIESTGPQYIAIIKKEKPSNRK
ncbi:class I SAM-dependent methyltransferase [Candidatus Bathyarchaeota archaeon]|nr:class I SAM-dependent methyltransferase [Candidatus Bathyarchaeota archaeon]